MKQCVVLISVLVALERSLPGICLVDDLETECTEPPLRKSDAPPPLTFPFRTDGLTRAEFCLRFHRETSCGQVMFGDTYSFDKCDNATDSEIRAHPWGSFAAKTYIDFNCPSEYREHMTKITKAIGAISPTRAITIALYDNEYDDLSSIHHDVVDPIRNQMIQLSAQFCKSPYITSKVYDAGMLPNLLRFQIAWYCHGLVIKKGDFSRMPQVRAIQFLISTTIAEMEPYTFTDLSNLQILTLEQQIAGDLYSRAENDHSMAKGFLPDRVFEYIRRLHCDCSYSWFRNFLKKKPYLIAGKKKGQVMTLGSFVLPDDDIRPPGSSANVTAVKAEDLRSLSVSMDIINTKWSPVLSVDCLRKFNWRNTQVGEQFSYNTSCFSLNC